MKNDEIRIVRDYACEVRSEQSEEHGNYIVGQPIVFGVGTDIGGMFEEIIEQHALDNTDLKDVRFLVNHDLTMIPLARSRNNNANSTMQLEVIEGGMNIRADLDTERNETARALYSAVERGDISGMSFRMSIDGEEWTNLESDYPTRHITSIGRVLEVSAVTMPAYEQTSIEARNDAAALESAKAVLESAKVAEAEKRSAQIADMETRLKKIMGV